ARRRVGYLPENPAFYDFLTAREYLRFVGTSFKMPPAAIREESARVLALLDLEAAADRPMRGYSKGMVQRLGLAQTLLHGADLFILDEPMSGLDPLGRALVKEIILDLKKKGKTVFFSTHVIADIERVCDRIGVVVGGVLQEERVVSDLLQEGVDGYFCRVRGGDGSFFETFGPASCNDGVREVFVERGRFDAFAGELLKHGGVFDLIEPRRRDVEDYFLALVRKAEGS
ncbi:MAG TPA: ABC transporter ATP-binding protein, partial [Desulfuromonadales bacterium]|nr:ABC transporter ATP-binding protein [Desulfuromonadales bacterium]